MQEQKRMSTDEIEAMSTERAQAWFPSTALKKKSAALGIGHSPLRFRGFGPPVPADAGLFPEHNTQKQTLAS
jgi:hypothetical protein